MGGNDYGPIDAPRSIAVADDDPNSILLAARTNTGSSVCGVFRSRDGGASWTAIVAPYAGMPVHGSYFVDRLSAYLFGTGGYVGFLDGDLLVDLPIPGGGTIVALMGP